VSAILLGKGTTDPFAPKVVRSTQGSLFHVPVYQVDLPLVVSQLKEEHWLVVGTSLHEAIDLREFKVKPDQKVAVVVGNEARGISPYVEQITDFNVKIPLFGGAESLNVSVAAGIVLYYVQFQRKGLNL
jgi:TrmH family RNA methyltransferase